MTEWQTKTIGGRDSDGYWLFVDGQKMPVSETEYKQRVEIERLRSERTELLAASHE